MTNKIVLLVANEPDPQLETEYNSWYTEKHIPMMFEFPGMQKASRYHLIGDNPECSRYLAVYEFASKEEMMAFTRSAEFAAAVKDFDQKWKDGGFKAKWGASYELIQSWEK